MACVDKLGILKAQKLLPEKALAQKKEVDMIYYYLIMFYSVFAILPRPAVILIRVIYYYLTLGRTASIYMKCM